MRVDAGHLIIIDDPGGPKTEEERRRARLWFEEAIAGFTDRRNLRDVVAVPCDRASKHRS